MKMCSFSSVHCSYEYTAIKKYKQKLFFFFSVYCLPLHEVFSFQATSLGSVMKIFAKMFDS